jgi:small subunit ribosomal protein S11
MAEKEVKKKATPAKAEKPQTEAKEAPVTATKEVAATTETPAEVKKVKKSKNKRTVTEGNVYIQSSFNNTIVTITDLKGNVIAWSSAGSNGFKGAKKATPYAAQISSEAAANKALTYGLEKVKVFVKGIGAGRDQAVRGIHAAGIDIESITDVTPIAHNGCRPRKARRV